VEEGVVVEGVVVVVQDIDFSVRILVAFVHADRLIYP
jgi:hypothetical protein